MRIGNVIATGLVAVSLAGCADIYFGHPNLPIEVQKEHIAQCSKETLVGHIFNLPGALLPYGSHPKEDRAKAVGRCLNKIDRGYVEVEKER